MTEERLREVEKPSPWGWCWSCRQPYSYEDLIYTGKDIHGQWRFECCFCHRAAKPVTQTWVQRARAHMMARQRLMAIWESTHA